MCFTNLQCVLSIIDSPLINTKDYIPFVDIFEDDGAVLNELGETDDGCSSQIFMNSGLPYGSRSETSLRVNHSVPLN